MSAPLTPERLAEIRAKYERDAAALVDMAYVPLGFSAVRDLLAEVARLSALVTTMHAAAVGETRPPLLGLVEDVAATRSAFEAQRNRADGLDAIAREMAKRVAELEDAAKAAPSRADVLREAADAIDYLLATMLAPPVDRYASGLMGAAGELRRMAEAGESA